MDTLELPKQSVRDRVRKESVAVLYGQAHPAVLISVLVAGLVCYVLWEVTSHTRLLYWLALITVLAVTRFALALSFLRRTNREHGVEQWERRFIVTIALTGLTWGVGGWLIMPAGSLAHQAALYMFLMGMAGGAAVSYAAHAGCVIVTIASIMLPSTTWFLLQGDFILHAMAAGGLIYLGTAYRASTMLASSLQRSHELSFELEIAYQIAEQLARTDALTGLKNRRAFYEFGEQAVQHAKRYEHPLSAVVLDIDHFKETNDTFGHSAGDATLRELARIIQGSARTTDVTGRVGGEEFAIVLPETGLQEAAAFAERMRRKVSEASLDHEGATVKFTTSFGVAECGPECTTLDALLAEADAALYEAKNTGRNRVVCRARAQA